MIINCPRPCLDGVSWSKTYVEIFYRPVSVGDVEKLQSLFHCEHMHEVFNEAGRYRYM